ncbi:MAG: peptidoglycan recognition protein [Knoellia sp.]
MRDLSARSLVRRRGLLATALASALLGAPIVASQAAPSPVAPSRTSVPLRGVDAAARGALSSAPPLADGLRVAALSAPLRLGRDSVVGVTWLDPAVPGKGDVGDVQVRTRDHRTWSAWEELHVDDSHGPDQGTAEAARARRGSAPLVVVGADYVQVRVATRTGRVPKDLRVDLIDPGATSADAPASTLPSASAGGVRPTIRTRAEWGADESIRKGSPSYGTVDVGFVHHTAGSNSYTAAEVPGIIRGIYAYHVKSLGWNDIGYNFLVDKWGRMWEGRAGGMDRAVIGAHTLGYNSHSFAMSALGNFENTTAPTAVEAAFTELFAWKLGVHHVDPLSTTTLTDADGSPTKVFRNVSGHRDFGDSGKGTECPGQRLYDRIDTLAPRMKAAQGAMFYRPTLDRRTWDHEAPGGVTVRATANTTLSWRLDVRSPGKPEVLASRTGSATTSSGLTARWDGLIGGLRVPVGSYELTLTAQSSATGSAGVVPPFVATVTVTRDTTIDDVLDGVDRKGPRGHR